MSGRPRIARAAAALALALTLVAATGCGSDEEEPAPDPAREVNRDIDDLIQEAGSGGGSAGGQDGGSEQAPSLTPPPCPPDASNCAEASGQIIYVERVDPDGDGDAHFVLLSNESITGPGLTVIDVRPELRPSPLPGVGDQLAASGPVFRGSYGQKQIQADAIRVGD